MSDFIRRIIKLANQGLPSALPTNEQAVKAFNAEKVPARLEEDWIRGYRDAVMEAAKKLGTPIDDGLVEGMYRVPNSSYKSPIDVGTTTQAEYLAKTYGEALTKVLDNQERAAGTWRHTRNLPGYLVNRRMLEPLLVVRAPGEKSLASTHFGIRVGMAPWELKAIGNYPEGAFRHEMGHHISHNEGLLHRVDRKAERLMPNERHVSPLHDERVTYSSRAPESAANMGQLKQFHFMRTGEILDTPRKAGDYLKQLVSDNVNREPVDPSLPGYERYGPDPVAEYGPMKGKVMEGANETEVNAAKALHRMTPDARAEQVKIFDQMLQKNDGAKKMQGVV